MQRNSKTAIVTGASRGIGRATAVALAKKGFDVVINYHSDETKAHETAQLIATHGVRVRIVQADVGQREDVNRLFDEAEEAFGGVDVVVNNAGASTFLPHEHTSEDDFDRVFRLNAKGAFLVLGEAARRVRNGGEIIQVSSSGTKMPSPAGGVYAASKAAGEQMAFALSKELGERHITVNVVSPGVTKTDGLTLPQPAIDQLVGMTPLGRLGEPRDVGDVIAMLTAPEARWINGQNIYVNGGVL